MEQLRLEQRFTIGGKEIARKGRLGEYEVYAYEPFDQENTYYVVDQNRNVIGKFESTATIKNEGEVLVGFLETKFTDTIVRPRK